MVHLNYQYGNSAAIVTLSNYNVLIDSGFSVYPTLRAKNLINSFQYTLITHLHDDHVGSLSVLILHRKLMPDSEKLTIIYPDEDFKEDLIRFLSHSLGTVEDYVHFKPITDFPEITAVDTKGQHVPNMQTWAYCFKENEQIIAYSGDLGNSDTVYNTLKPFAGEYDITVFHELTFLEGIKSHTFYTELEKYKGICAIYGYHCDPSLRANDLSIPLVFDHKDFLH